MSIKKLEWIKDSRKILKGFPSKVKHDIGFALRSVQKGNMPHNTKPLKGFSHGVMEIKSRFDTNRPSVKVRAISGQLPPKPHEPPITSKQLVLFH